MRREARRQPQAPFPRDSDWEMELDQAAVTYPGAVPVHALRPVSLQFAAGETVAVAGRSGSGLTALRGREFGFVFQSFHLLADRTAAENAELGLVYRGMGALERRAAACNALERVGLGHRLPAMPGTLSGGEQQRVAIARALTQQPTVLLCDEPTGNLDRQNAELVTNLLRGLAAEGLTVIMVTHDLEIAAGMHRFLDIDDGLITERDAVNR